MLTTLEVAKKLRVSTRTVHRLISREGLPAFTIGGQYRFPEREFQDWLVRKTMRTLCDQQEVSTPGRKASISGSKSTVQMDGRYEGLLKPRTRKKPNAVSNKKLQSSVL